MESKELSTKEQHLNETQVSKLEIKENHGNDQDKKQITPQNILSIAAQETHQTQAIQFKGTFNRKKK